MKYLVEKIGLFIIEILFNVLWFIAELLFYLLFEGFFGLVGAGVFALIFGLKAVSFENWQQLILYGIVGVVVYIIVAVPTLELWGFIRRRS